MESLTSKVFIECKKFLFIGQIVKHDGFWDLVLATCQRWYPLFQLLRLADMRGGINKVNYYVCQIDLLIEAGLDGLKKWSAPSCPADKIWSVSMRRLDKVIRREILRTRDWMMNVTLGMVHSFVYDKILPYM